MVNDEELRNEFLDGSEEAYDTIYRTHIQSLYSYGLRLGLESEELKDYVQDIFYKLLCNPHLLDEVSNLRAYLFRALKNRWQNALRDTKPTTEINDSLPEFSGEVNALETIIDNEEREGMTMRLNNLLASLTSRQREAVFLRYIYELPYDEIAATLDMSVPSARNLISRAIEHMRNLDSEALSIFLLV